MEIESKCLHLAKKTNAEQMDRSGALSFPIYQSATFGHRGLGESTGYDYTRMQNPTREHLENTIKELENGIDAVAFSSGMAAIGAVMELFSAGDAIIADMDLYGGSVRLFENISRKNGVAVMQLDVNKQDVEAAITTATKAVYIETPTNPMMRVIDIKKLADLAHRHGLLLIVDNTFLSPYFQNPLDLGADIVIHSGTKFLSGHHDTICGFVVVKDEKLADKMRFILKTTGAGLSPFDSWLVVRGIKTLSVRMEKEAENAMELAKWLKEQKKVKKVLYPGLPEHEGFEVMKNQSRGFGAMLTFVVDSKETAVKLLEKVELITFAESLGGCETLVTYPITQTHPDLSKEQLDRCGITDCLLRLSVGLENVEDLKKDLSQALED
ncbi:MAG: PLP-dependent aspartate aminotransferase family protein [Acetatifactor sp.]|nr:PLP-dependent aspartate aminotransferase family protein [Acetatifactor sp.]